MLCLRPYKPCDADIIVSWIKTEAELRKWSADRYGAFPITADDIRANYSSFDNTQNFFPMIAYENGEVVGHFIMRFTDEAHFVLRFGFIIAAPEKRGKGYGKIMLAMGIKYAKEFLHVKKITLGVFDNNEPAYKCYTSLGFTENIKENHIERLMGENWLCRELEMTVAD